MDKHWLVANNGTLVDVKHVVSVFIEQCNGRNFISVLTTPGIVYQMCPVGDTADDGTKIMTPRQFMEAVIASPKPKPE